MKVKKIEYSEGVESEVAGLPSFRKVKRLSFKQGAIKTLMSVNERLMNVKSLRDMQGQVTEMLEEVNKMPE